MNRPELLPHTNEEAPARRAPLERPELVASPVQYCRRHRLPRPGTAETEGESCYNVFTLSCLVVSRSRLHPQDRPPVIFPALSA